MKKPKPIEILVSQENADEFSSCYSAIRQFLDYGQDVPFQLIDVLFRLMFSKKKFEFIERWKEAEFLTAKAVQTLETKKDFKNLKWSKKKLRKSEVYVEYDTRKICFEIMSAYLLYKAVYPDTNKDDTFSFFYQVFDEEYKSLCIKKHGKSFSPYKHAVFCGILTMATGFKLTNKQNPSNNEIFQASRHAIKKYQKES